MITLNEAQQRMLSDPEHWSVCPMDFVDDFRYYKDVRQSRNRSC
jgi:hypothetical protein